MLVGSSKKMVGSQKQYAFYVLSDHLSWSFRSNLIFILLAGKWIEYDDDNPKPRVEDDITRLSGGGEKCTINLWNFLFYFSFFISEPSTR